MLLLFYVLGEQAKVIRFFSIVSICIYYESFYQLVYSCIQIIALLTVQLSQELSQDQ